MSSALRRFVQRYAAVRSLVHQASVTLIDAQIKALPTTYPTIAGAPGATRLLLPSAGILFPTFSATYTNIGQFSPQQGTGLILVAYGDWLEEALGYLSAAWILNSARIAYMSQWMDENSFLSDASVSAASDPSSILDQPLKLIAGNVSDFTGGNANNRLAICVDFRVYDTLTNKFLTQAESGWRESTRTFA